MYWPACFEQAAHTGRYAKVFVIDVIDDPVINGGLY